MRRFLVAWVAVLLLGLPGVAVADDGGGSGAVSAARLSRLRVANAAAAEADGVIEFVARIDRPALTDVKFLASTKPVRSIPGVDYVPLSNEPFMIPAGQTSVTVPVQVIDDGVLERNDGPMRSPN